MVLGWPNSGGREKREMHEGVRLTKVAIACLRKFKQINTQIKKIEEYKNQREYRE